MRYIVSVLCAALILAGCRPIAAPTQPSLVDQRLHLADLTRTADADIEALANDEALWVDDTWRRETIATLREAAALAHTLAAESSYQRDLLIARAAAFAWAADSVEAFDLAGLSAAATMLAQAVPPPPTATPLPQPTATPVPTPTTDSYALWIDPGIESLRQRMAALADDAALLDDDAWRRETARIARETWTSVMLYATVAPSDQQEGLNDLIAVLQVLERSADRGDRTGLRAAMWKIAQIVDELR